MRSFASDNNSGVHPLVMDALAKANVDHALGYGEDVWTEEATRKIKELFTDDCVPLFTFNGTGSNTMSLQMLCHSFHIIYCTRNAHILVDECGAPAKAVGCSICPIDTPDGKLTPLLVSQYITGVGEQHHSQPGALYISQCTELGTVYTPEELKELVDFAHSNGMKVHMDGARLANAAAALGLSVKEISQDCGVDTLVFGGTKNGMMFGECVVVFNDALKRNAIYYRKQANMLASKMRYLACQFSAILTDNLYLECAAKANEMAKYMRSELSQFQQIIFTQKTESNQLFMKMPRRLIDELLKHYTFFIWDENNDEVRLVTSFDTTREDVDDFITCLKSLV